VSADISTELVEIFEDISTSAATEWGVLSATTIKKLARAKSSRPEAKRGGVADTLPFHAAIIYSIQHFLVAVVSLTS
jgi:hypothetical protein